MKKLNLVVFVIIASVSTTFIACNTSAEKVEKAEADVKEANEKLEKANSEYRTDMEDYRKKTIEKIEANNKTIADFKENIKKKKRKPKMIIIKK